MDPITIAALITAGTTLIGGLLGQEAQKENTAQDRKFQEQNLLKQQQFAAQEAEKARAQSTQQFAEQMKQRQLEARLGAIQAGASGRAAAIQNLIASLRG